MTQTEHPRNGALTLFLAFVGGALVGGAAAVLFAPRSGAETRQRITGAVDDTKEVASRVPQQVVDGGRADLGFVALEIADACLEVSRELWRRKHSLVLVPAAPASK